MSSAREIDEADLKEEELAESKVEDELEKAKYRSFDCLAAVGAFGFSSWANNKSLFPPLAQNLQECSDLFDKYQTEFEAHEKEFKEHRKKFRRRAAEFKEHKQEFEAREAEFKEHEKKFSGKRSEFFNLLCLVRSVVSQGLFDDLAERPTCQNLTDRGLQAIASIQSLFLKHNCPVIDSKLAVRTNLVLVTPEQRSNKYCTFHTNFQRPSHDGFQDMTFTELCHDTHLANAMDIFEEFLSSDKIQFKPSSSLDYHGPELWWLAPLDEHLKTERSSRYGSVRFIFRAAKILMVKDAKYTLLNTREYKQEWCHSILVHRGTCHCSGFESVELAGSNHQLNDVCQNLFDPLSIAADGSYTWHKASCTGDQYETLDFAVRMNLNFGRSDFRVEFMEHTTFCVRAARTGYTHDPGQGGCNSTAQEAFGEVKQLFRANNKTKLFKKLLNSGTIACPI